MTTVADNGVNVQALLERARGAEGRARGRPVHLAGVLQVAGRRAHHRHGQGLLRPRRGAQPQAGVGVRGRPPGGLRGRRTTASRRSSTSSSAWRAASRAGVASVAQNRGIQLRSVEAIVEGGTTSAASSAPTATSATASTAIKVTFHIDADASQGRHRGAGRPVAEALGGVRRAHQPDRRHRRSRLRAARAHRAHHHGRHRRGARGPGREPLPDRAVDRPRRPRARRGGELLAAASAGTRCGC